MSGLISTDDITLASFLAAKGYAIAETKQNGRFLEFCFLDEAKSLIDQWLLNPSEEMRLVQDFTKEKERLFRVIKQSRSGNGRQTR